MWFWWCMYHDLLRSNEVKCWSKPSNQGQIGQISRNIPNIHMFRLRISSRIQIQDYLRSNQVIKRSNLDQTVTDIKCLFDKGDTQDHFKTKTIWASKSKARYCAWSSSLFPAFIVKSLQSDLDQYWKEQLFYCHEFITEVVGSVEPNSVFVQEKDLRSRKKSWNNNKDLDFL